MIDRVTAQAQLNAWLAASLALTKSQSYEIGGRKLTRANTDEVRRMIQYWEGKVAEAGRRFRTSRSVVVPL